MKKIIVAKAGCVEVGNELLNYMSVYAWGLEAGASVANPFFLKRGIVWKILGALYGRWVSYTKKTCLLLAWRSLVYLPPTKPLPAVPASETLYCFGWLFRNPAGITKHRETLLRAFGPDVKTEAAVARTLEPLNSKKVLIGVHIRQTPLTGFAEGEFLVSPDRVRAIVAEFVNERRLTESDIGIVVVSERRVEFPYETVFIKGDNLPSLFALSKCAAIIGTNSTFSNVAAWIGDVPHVVTSRNNIDWGYYHDKSNYFDNKYATFTYR